jgi:hypothetical protein
MDCLHGESKLTLKDSTGKIFTATIAELEKLLG